MLGCLFSQNPDHWPVVGITPAALEIFANSDFKRKSRQGINRAHIVDRNSTYTYLLSVDIDFDLFWKTVTNSDKTILATSSENKNILNLLDHVLPIDTSLGLFKSKGFAWRHGAAEIAFLRGLYQIIGIIDPLASEESVQ